MVVGGRQHCLDLRCVVAVESRRRVSAAMNLSDDALRDLTPITELKSDGGMLQRHFELLKGYVTII